MTRLVVLISGRGSNMQAIVHACQQDQLDAEVVAVISNNPDAAGLKFATQHNIPAHTINHRQYDSRANFDKALLQQIDQYRPDWVALAGFMRILEPAFVTQYLGRLINIHPSLLPAYPGLNTHQRVLEAGEQQHGASVHFVTPELDAGPVILQSRVDVLPNDNVERLQSRVLNTEHALYVEALQLCVSKAARFVDGECYFSSIKNSSAAELTNETSGFIPTAPNG